MKLSPGVQQTMLIPLWGRAQASRLYPEILVDEQAIAIVENPSYDFTAIAEGFNSFGGMSHLVRARAMDDAVRDYLVQNPRAAVVDIGAGLDTNLSRVNNGNLRWFDLDLPDALTFRDELIPPDPHSGRLAFSMFDTSWFDEIGFVPRDGAVFMAAGVFYFFKEEEIRALLVSMAERFPGGLLIFDANSSEALAVSNQMMQKTGNTGAIMCFSVDDPHLFESWSPHIRLREARPRFSRVPRLPQMSDEMKTHMDACDRDMRIMQIELELV